MKNNRMTSLLFYEN